MNRTLLASTALVGAGILYAVFSSSKPPSRYALSVSEFLAHPPRDEPVRVQGRLVPGSLLHRDEPCEYRFQLVDRESGLADAASLVARPELSVRYANCIVPDTFRDAPGFETAEITVEGKLCQRCHDFEASKVYAKMGWKYEMKHREAGVPKAPIGL
jgi:cytochrome c-type biogenesis protein CcmE